ncbi:glycerate kinase [Sporosarcina thermotolerans]|uniref:Glycerate kinase n=1 Tax=Sporosarcina thermotolerans TaxID=633404 RepID=A0AAW9ABD5_9BACL|nr:glycerate kinase [Sporosarcina thermotolerans]MDW0118812.1 glycerate kinase [Sporosarcina thermotolerans]
MKVILAPDSFKGSLAASEAAEAMAKGVCDVNSDIRTVLLPVADGGEGTMRSLVDATKGKYVSINVEDPLGRPIRVSYGILGDGETCSIEIAEASGIMRLKENERNPRFASSYGTGQLIVHALDSGYRKFIIGLGGSATNDGGAGILQALGMRLLDKEGIELAKGGGGLQYIYSINREKWDERIADCEFLIASDVKNPFIGHEGASVVFGPQKGASPTDVDELDRNLRKFADVVEKETGISLHSKEGAGAAGGLGGAFQAFFNCEMQQGIDVVLEAIDFEEHVKDADLIITGEGKTDLQTLSGKAPFGIAKVAHRLALPIILISGAVDEEIRGTLTPLFTEVHAIMDENIPAEDAITNAYDHLRRKTKKVLELIREKGV